MKRLFLVWCSLFLSFLFLLDVNAYAADDVNLSDLPVSTSSNVDGMNIINDTGLTVYFEMEGDSYGRKLFFRENDVEHQGGSHKYITLNPGDRFITGNYGSGYSKYVHLNDFYGRPAPPPVDPTPASTPVVAPAHTHDFVEGEIYAATQTTDGLGGLYCKSCGAIKESWPISAYGYSINDYATPMVNAAKSGQNITFEFDEWNSFPKAFMEKIAAKSLEGVTFVFHYKWNHVKQEITIPYGTIVDTSLDWYGPAKMAELYGAN